MTRFTLVATLGASATVSLLVLILLLQMPAFGAIITIASLFPFIGILLSGSTYPTVVSSTLAISIGALLGVGLFYLLVGAYFAAIVDIGYGIFWITRVLRYTE